MNAKILLPITLLLLNACGRQNTEPAAAPSAPASQAAQADVQTLTSTDGKIRITVKNGQFRDKIQDKALYPEGMSDGGLTLLQQDPESGITIYAGNLGEAKTDAKAYFDTLKQMLKSDSGIEALRIGMATDNRMNYQFSQSSTDGGRFSENCIAIHGTNIYTVCAGSPSASEEQLAFVLKDINLVK